MRCQYHKTGLFTPENFVERFNNDLCNDLGNLLNRTVAMCNKYFEGFVPKYNGYINEVDEKFEKETIQKIKSVEEYIEKFEMNNALQEIFNIVSRTNKYIDETMPWAQAKDENKEPLESTIYHLIENLRKIAIMIIPVMPKTAEKILLQIGVSQDSIDWESMEKYESLQDKTKVIEKGEPLFMRLNTEEEIDYIKSQMNG